MSITVRIDAYEVLDELSTAELEEELRSRKKKGAERDEPFVALPTAADTYTAWSREVVATARAGDWQHLDILLAAHHPAPKSKLHA